MFSWKSAFTALTSSRDREYARDATRWNTTVAIPSGTRATTTIAPSDGSVTMRAAATPTIVNSAMTVVDRPVCRNDESASMSVVIRVMMRPDSSRS